MGSLEAATRSTRRASRPTSPRGLSSRRDATLQHRGAVRAVAALHDPAALAAARSVRSRRPGRLLRAACSAADGEDDDPARAGEGARGGREIRGDPLHVRGGGAGRGRLRGGPTRSCCAAFAGTGRSFLRRSFTRRLAGRTRRRLADGAALRAWAEASLARPCCPSTRSTRSRASACARCCGSFAPDFRTDRGAVRGAWRGADCTTCAATRRRAAATRSTWARRARST